MTCILATILNAAMLVRHSFKLRLIVGVFSYMLGFVFIYSGFLLKNFAFVCLGGVCTGFGATLTFLAILGFMKYYPSNYFIFFLAGNISGGLILTVFYLVCTYNHMKVYTVRHLGFGLSRTILIQIY